MATVLAFTLSLLRSFLLLLLTCRCSLAVQNINIYHKYYVIDSCTDDENITYELSEMGIYSVAKIGAFRTSELHYGSRNCTITIKPPSGYSVYLQIESFSFGSLYNRSVGCASYIQVSGNGMISAKLCGLRSTLPSTSFTSYGNMTIIFHTGSDYHSAGLGFTLIAIAYKTSCTDNDYFVCDNGRCIWQGLICDTVDNCGDRSDEKLLGRSECFDLEPFTINPVDINWKVTFSPEIVSYPSSHNISVGAALATAVFVILGAFIRFYCYYQCNQARRQQVLSAVTIIRARSVLRSPAMNNATPPPPYETLVNDPEGHPENPPEYTTVNGMSPASASCSTTGSSAPSQRPADKNENISCGPPPPYEP